MTQKRLRYRARLWLDGELVMNHVVKTKTPLEMQRHMETSAAFAASMAAKFGKAYTLELEFLDERAPSKRFMRFGNDPRRPLDPVKPH
jgi:hypothetical protein